MKKVIFSPPLTFAGLSGDYADRDKAKVVVLPVPYDGTTSWRSGTRDGPKAIIDASRYLELYDLELDCEIYRAGIHTLPELEPDMSGPEPMIERVYQAVRAIINEDRTLLMLGGEHSLTLGAVRAYHEKYGSLSVLHLDAHADLRNSFMGTKFSHGTVMRRVHELCPIVPVGIRSLSLEEHKFTLKAGLRPFYADWLKFDEVITSKIIASLSDRVYISLDVDVLDPAVMPATGTPEPGGIGWGELLHLLKHVTRERHVVGADIMELSPGEGPAACAFLVAKLAYKLIGYIVAADLSA